MELQEMKRKSTRVETTLVAMVAKDVRKRYGKEAARSFLEYIAAWKRARNLARRGLRVIKPKPQIGRPYLLLIEAGKK